MTDRGDRKRRPETNSEQGEAESSEFVSGSNVDSATSDDETESDSGTDGPLTVEETVQLSATRSEEKLFHSTSLRPAIKSVTPTEPKTALLSVNSEPDTVVEAVSPQPRISVNTSKIAPHSIEVRQITERARSNTRPKVGRTEQRGQTHLDSQQLTVTRKPDVISRETRPSTSLSLARVQGGQALLDEIEEIDPVFGWSGGLPYGTNRPTLILHCAEEGISSFSFLQRCLRDTYAELEGGEPTVEPVEFVANEPQVPVVGGRIVTLDLTGGDWSPSASGDRPTIERGGIDIVPTFVELVETLYSGGLGYAVVNLPSEWEGTFRRSQFFATLVDYIAEASSPETASTEETGALEKLRTAPVTIARPRVTDADAFDARVALYFGFDRVPEWETIAQADTAFSNLLRSEHWAQVALTERQSYGEESSRHYNWKGLLTEGIARQLWIAATDGEIPFNTFVQQSLRGEDLLQTEYPLGGPDPDDAAAIADIHLKEEQDWVSQAVKAFAPEGEYEAPLVIEFETGFSEGAFQHRKLVESIEKYETVGSVETVLLAIPPRLLYRGERQARLLNQLVDSEDDRLESTTAELCVPVLAEGSCTGVRRATEIIQVLYNDD